MIGHNGVEHAHAAFVENAHDGFFALEAAGEGHANLFGFLRQLQCRKCLHMARIVDNGCAVQPGFQLRDERLYRTGDLGRWTADGMVEYLGAKDGQLKVRGYRIEPGEIEYHLLRHPGVSQAVVEGRAGPAGSMELVAYVVASAAPTAAELRAFLKSGLPDHMLPAAFVFLAAMPLTPSGKVDRKALPTPEEPSGDRRYGAPRDVLEQQLVELWETLLSVRPIGIQDGLFDLGGHSLLAVQLAAAIEKRFGKRLPVSRIFELPTIAGIAALLRKDGEMPEMSCLVRIRPRGSRPPLFFLPGVGGMVSYLYPLAQQLGSAIPVFAFQARGLDGKSAPHETVEAMASHYVALLLEVQPHGPYHLAGHSFGGQVAFAMARILLERGYEIGLLAMIDTYAPGIASAGLADDTASSPDMGQLLTELFHREITFSQEAMGGLSADEQMANIVRELEERDLLPEGGGADQLRCLLNVFRANLRMHLQFSPQSCLPLPIVLFRASEETVNEPADLGWGRYSGRPVSICRVPGNHVTMMRPPHVGNLARILTQAMEDASRLAPASFAGLTSKT